MNSTFLFKHKITLLELWCLNAYLKQSLAVLVGVLVLDGDAELLQQRVDLVLFEIHDGIEHLTPNKRKIIYFIKTHFTTETKWKLSFISN